MKQKYQHPDNEIIDALGGTGRLAAICEIRQASVSEWRQRGIPKARRMYLKLLFPDVFRESEKSAA